MSTFKPWRSMVAVVCALAFAAPTQASVVISGTRVVYDQREREVTIRLTNDGKLPALVQAWIDDGDAKADPATIKVPFTLTPPMFRIDSAKGQSLRLIYTQEPLPQDKESVFWLNVLEVPPRPKAASANMVQLAFRTRIKLFFRPTGLAGRPEDSPAMLQWSVVPGEGGGRVLRVSNPTPFHVSFAHLGVAIGGANYQNEAGGMVAPGATSDFPVTLSAAPTVASDEPVQFIWINDYGGNVTAGATLGGGS